MNKEKDSLRFYYLGKNYETKIEQFGAKMSYEPRRYAYGLVRSIREHHFLVIFGPCFFKIFTLIVINIFRGLKFDNPVYIGKILV